MDWFFKVIAGIFILSFKITFHIIVGISQSIWYAAHGESAKIGDAIGGMGREITNSMADYMKTLFS